MGDVRRADVARRAVLVDDAVSNVTSSPFNARST
jgi:hypothetical protein